MFVILLRHVFFSDEEWKQSDYIKDVLNCSSRIIYDIFSNFIIIFLSHQLQLFMVTTLW